MAIQSLGKAKDYLQVVSFWVAFLYKIFEVINELILGDPRLTGGAVYSIPTAKQATFPAGKLCLDVMWRNLESFIWKKIPVSSICT